MANETLIPILQKHPDGEWWTTETEHKGYKLMTKMRQGHGAKIHVFGSSGSVVKTFSFYFATPEKMIDKAQKWIDKL